MLDPSRGPFEPFWGHVEELTLETLSPVASEVASLSLRSIFSPKPSSCLGRALQKCPLKRAYVGPSWGYVGAMFAHLGAMLGLYWPPGGDFGLCCFHDFTFIPKVGLEKAFPSGLQGTHSIFATLFLWKSWILPGTGTPLMSAWRLPPVACEVPGSASRGVGGSGRPPLSKARFASATAQPDFKACGRVPPTCQVVWPRYLLMRVRWCIFEVDQGKRKREGKEEERREGERKWKDSMNNRG